VLRKLDDDIQDESTSTFLTWILEFGNMIPIHGDVVNGNAVNQIFVPDQTMRASLNFGAGNPVPEVRIPYAFTTTSPNPMMRISVELQAIGNSGATHSLSVSYPLQPVPTGNVTIMHTEEF
jgi:hypothetical protein